MNLGLVTGTIFGASAAGFVAYSLWGVAGAMASLNLPF